MPRDAQKIINRFKKMGFDVVYRPEGNVVFVIDWEKKHPEGNYSKVNDRLLTEGVDVVSWEDTRGARFGNYSHTVTERMNAAFKDKSGKRPVVVLIDVDVPPQRGREIASAALKGVGAGAIAASAVGLNRTMQQKKTGIAPELSGKQKPGLTRREALKLTGFGAVLAGLSRFIYPFFGQSSAASDFFWNKGYWIDGRSAEIAQTAIDLQPQLKDACGIKKGEVLVHAFKMGYLHDADHSRVGFEKLLHPDNDDKREAELNRFQKQLSRLPPYGRVPVIYGFDEKTGAYKRAGHYRRNTGGRFEFKPPKKPLEPLTRKPRAPSWSRRRLFSFWRPRR